MLFAMSAPREPYGALRPDMPHRLREMRQQARLTLEGLAERVGLDWRTVQKHETEPQRLRVADLALYAEALGCSRIDLIDDQPAITDEERRIMALFRALPRPERERVLIIAEALTGQGSANGRAA